MNRNEQHSHTCKKCKEIFEYTQEDVFWDEKGYGYSTKLTHCSKCGCINVLKIIEDRAMKKINRDEREYGL